MRTYLTLLLGLSCLHGVLIAAIARVAGTLEPKFNTTSEVVTVKRGDRAILPCSVEFLGEHSVIWVNPRKILMSHLDRRTIDDHRISVERPYIKEWNLLIRDVRHNDSGIYECRINTKPKQSKKIKLDVQVPPMIISERSSDRISLEEGETATLVCNVTGIPKPNVTWFKRNSLKIDGKKERIGTEGEVLVIHNVSRMCDDIYECYVDNGVPPAVSKAIRVIVDYAPEVQLPNKRIGQMAGKETILDCYISANPQAVTEWRRYGKALMKSMKYDLDIFRRDYENPVTLSLRIKNLESSDYGSYVCVGSNHLGEDQEEMILYEITTTTSTTTTTTTPSTSATHWPVTTRNLRPYPGEYPYETNHPDLGRTGKYGGGGDGEGVRGEDGGTEEEWKPVAERTQDNTSREGGNRGNGNNGNPLTVSEEETNDAFSHASRACWSHTVLHVVIVPAFMSLLLGTA